MKALAILALLLVTTAAQAHGPQRVQLLGAPVCAPPVQTFRSTVVFERQEVIVPREVLVPQVQCVQPRLAVPSCGCYGGGVDTLGFRAGVGSFGYGHGVGVGVDSFLLRESRFGGRLRVSTPGFFLSIR